MLKQFLVKNLINKNLEFKIRNTAILLIPNNLNKFTFKGKKLSIEKSLRSCISQIGSFSCHKQT